MSPRSRLPRAFLVAAMLVPGASLSHAESWPPDTADLFGLEVSELASRFESAPEGQRAAVGLVLADLRGTMSPEDALKTLSEVEPLAEGTVWSPAAVAYDSAIRCGAQLRLSNRDEAEKLCTRARAALDGVDRPFIRARTLNAVQFFALRSGDLETALELGREAWRAAQATDSPYLQATTLNTSALVFAYSGLHDQAIDCFMDARRLLVGFEDRALPKMITFNLGLSHTANGDHEQALEAFHEGFLWAHSTGQAHRAFIGRIEVANALNRLGRWQETLDLLAPEVADQSSRRDPDSYLHAIRALALAQLKLGDAAGALRQVERGLEMARELPNPNREVQLQLLRVEVLQELNRPREALRGAQALAARLRGQMPTDHLDEALLLLSEMQAASGDQASAYETLLVAQEIEREERGKAFARRVALTEVANELERRERERLLAQEREASALARLERNRVVFFGLALVLGLSGLASFLNLRRQAHAEALRKNVLSPASWRHLSFSAHGHSKIN